VPATSMALLAQAALGGYSMVQLGVIVIVVAAVIGIVYVILRQMGVMIPPFIVQIMWILLAAFVGILALYFLVSMVGRIG
jgi:hypothetical protein